jgi:hypothetical protein
MCMTQLHRHLRPCLDIESGVHFDVWRCEVPNLFLQETRSFYCEVKSYRGIIRFSLSKKDEGIAQQDLKWAMSGAGLKIVLCL